ncbi:hypothetical protein PG984_007129 [Apiospora sp. TS-2023a]
MELQQMPVEVLGMIFGQLKSKKDLANLCLVSKDIRAAVLRVLYQSVILGPKGCVLPDQGDGTRPEKFRPVLEYFDAGKLIPACERNHLYHTQSLTIRTPFYADLYSDPLKGDCSYGHCFHRLEELEQGQRFANQIASKLLPVLQACDENVLRSFSWEAGVCPPQAILGPSGYLTTNLKNLTSIRLITYGNCRGRSLFDTMDHPDVPSLALLGFPCLRELSWAGLSNHQCGTLAPLLQHRATQLTKLELDLEYHQWTTEHGHLRFFSKGVLRLHRPGSIVFSALKSLSLSNFDLRSYNFAIASSVNFSNLEHLKLRFCDGTERVLQHLTESVSNKLRAVEINMGISFLSANDQQKILIAFLESFQGLEELYMNMSYWPTGLTTEIWRAVGHHSKTLRGFDYHQRQHVTNVYSRLEYSPAPRSCLRRAKFGIVGGQLSWWLRVEESTLPFVTPSQFGPGVLAKVDVSPFRLKSSSLQLLHMRRSGLDSRLEEYLMNKSSRTVAVRQAQESQDRLRLELHNFLQWVFGPGGIRSLQLFVYGDFSHEGRYRQYCKMMCRNERREAVAEDAEVMFYREAMEEDRGPLSLLEEHKDLVFALPSDGMFGGQHPDEISAQ